MCYINSLLLLLLLSRSASRRTQLEAAVWLHSNVFDWLHQHRTHTRHYHYSRAHCHQTTDTHWPASVYEAAYQPCEHSVQIPHHRVPTPLHQQYPAQHLVMHIHTDTCTHTHTMVTARRTAVSYQNNTPWYSTHLLHCVLSCAVYCNCPCLCVCLFVGPPYYSQRALFASPLSAFSLQNSLLMHSDENRLANLRLWGQFRWYTVMVYHYYNGTIGINQSHTDMSEWALMHPASIQPQKLVTSQQADYTASQWPAVC